MINVLEILMWSGIGLIVGLFFMGWATEDDRKEMKKSYDDMLRLAYHDLDDAEVDLKAKQELIDQLKKELAVKQNVIDSQNERVNAQRREIERMHKRLSSFYNEQSSSTRL